jgi:hypothetical protein
MSPRPQWPRKRLVGFVFQFVLMPTEVNIETNREANEDRGDAGGYPLDCSNICMPKAIGA